MSSASADFWSSTAAHLALGGIAVSALCLALLHWLSSEFEPSWRMVSEYANGRYPALLTLVFAAWAVSSFALALALWPLAASTLGKVGLAFLVLAGIGQVLGAVFDINHKLHGPAAMLGIPSLCIAAVALTLAMSRRSDLTAPPMWSAHLLWISFVIMLIGVAVFFAALKAAGVDMSQGQPLARLPNGVTGYVGWANRFFFFTAYLWVVLTSLALLKPLQRGH